MLVPETLYEEVVEIAEDLSCSLTPLSASAFDSVSGDTIVKALFRVGTLDSFGQFERVEVSTLGALINYLEITQKGKLPLPEDPTKTVCIKNYAN